MPPTPAKVTGSKDDIRFKTDEFIAGSVAAFLNTTCLFPINKLIFRQMVGGFKFQLAADQMREEGLRYLYRGILPPLIQKMASVSIMFGSFGHYKRWANDKYPVNHHILNTAIASCLTGATEAVLTPLERVQMLLQDRSYHRDYRNTFDALVKMRTFGFKEYYRGLTCVLIRNGPSNILFFGLRDEIKTLLHKYGQRRFKLQPPPNSQNSSTKNQNSTESRSHPELSTMNSLNISPSINQRTQTHPTIREKFTLMAQNRDSILYEFFAGAILGSCISTLFYPLSVVRTRMQTREPGSQFISIVKAFKQVYSERDRKFSRFFHGCSINIFRQFLSWGIINCSYEMVLRYIHNNFND